MPDPSGVLARGRAAQVGARFNSACTVWRDTGAKAQDDDSDYEGRVHRGAHRDLPARVKPGRSQTVRLGDLEFQQAQAEVHVPAATTDVRDGDLIEMTSGESTGVWFRVVEAVLPEGRTARRLPVEQVDRPEDFTEEAL